MKMKLNRLFLALPIAALLALAVPAIAAAHTGNITSGASCEEGWVTVSLDHNTTADRTVTVTTDIPDTTGIAGGHFDTSYGEIWSASGPQPFAGTVTLTIDAGTQAEFTTSRTIAAASDCVEQPTPNPEPATPTGHANVRCDPDQDPGWILTYGANNPTDEPITVALFLDGADAGVTPPLTVQPGHDASRFVDYDHEQQVTLYVGELVIFDETLPVPHCSPHPDTPTITLPPTSSADQVAIVPASVDQSVSAVLLLLGGLGIVFIALGRRRRTD